VGGEKQINALPENTAVSEQIKRFRKSLILPQTTFKWPHIRSFESLHFLLNTDIPSDKISLDYSINTNMLS
jgi:hypothetical protein